MKKSNLIFLKITFILFVTMMFSFVYADVISPPAGLFLTAGILAISVVAVIVALIVFAAYCIIVEVAKSVKK